jgi:hypothetical protein
VSRKGIRCGGPRFVFTWFGARIHGRSGIEGYGKIPGWKAKTKRKRENPRKNVKSVDVSPHSSVLFSRRAQKKKKKIDVAAAQTSVTAFWFGGMRFHQRESHPRSTAEPSPHPQRTTNACLEFLYLIARRRRTNVFLNTFLSISMYTYIYIYIYVCVCVRACVRNIFRSPIPPPRAPYTNNSNTHPSSGISPATVANSSSRRG